MRDVINEQQPVSIKGIIKLASTISSQALGLGILQDLEVYYLEENTSLAFTTLL